MFLSSGDSKTTKQRHCFQILMFCSTRAFQFDIQMITIKQSTVILGPKNFLLLPISGQTVGAITRQFKEKVHPNGLLISDVRSDEIAAGKNTVDRFSISLLVLKIFAVKVQKLVIWRPSS